MTRRRLDWEAWRDSLLSAAGVLDLTMGGKALPGGFSGECAPFAVLRFEPAGHGRHVADPRRAGSRAHSPWRTETLTPLQGLFALNSPFILRQSDLLGKWMMGQGIEASYQRLFQRTPTSRESRAANDYLRGREKDAAVWSG